MRNYSFIAMFFALMFGLAVTSAYACAPGCPCEPGDGPAGGGGSNPANSSGNHGGVLGAIERHADAKRVEQKAHARQVLKQNDNAPGMTCFDNAMTLTSRLGGIFSDVAPTGIIPPQNTAVFGASSFPDFGASTKLVKGLNQVVSPTLQSHVSNFSDSLSAALGATVAGYLNDFVNTTIQPLLDSIAAPLATLNGYVTTMNTYFTTIQSIMTILGATMPVAVPALVATINTWWNTINNFISTAVSAITSAIASIINNITSIINSAVSSLVAAATPDGDCSRLAQLWGNDFPGGFRSLIGSAVERGTPYFTMFEMLQGNIPNNFGTAGTHLMQEIFNGSNDDIISRALADIVPGGPLSGPGFMPSWPAVPTFAPGATTADIISQM